MKGKSLANFSGSALPQSLTRSLNYTLAVALRIIFCSASRVTSTGSAPTEKKKVEGKDYAVSIISSASDTTHNTHTIPQSSMTQREKERSVTRIHHASLAKPYTKQRQTPPTSVSSEQLAGATIAQRAHKIKLQGGFPLHSARTDQSELGLPSVCRNDVRGLIMLTPIGRHKHFAPRAKFNRF